MEQLLVKRAALHDEYTTQKKGKNKEIIGFLSACKESQVRLSENEPAV
jgi:hypothetical protein